MKQPPTSINPTLLFAKAEAAYRGGRLAEATSLLARVRGAAGAHPAVLHLSALVAKKSGNAEEAQTFFHGALRLAPRDPEILSNWGNLLGELGRSSEALAAYAQALAVRPSFISALLNRAALLQKLGRHQEALADLVAADGLRPGQAQVWSMRGASQLASGQLAAAAGSYDQAIALDPKRVKALVGRASIAAQRGEPQAPTLLAAAVAAEPADPELRLQLAEALEAEGSGEALKLLEAAVDRQPDWVAGQRALARMRWEAGHGERFTDAIEARLAEVPGSVDLWLALAGALASADKHAAAAHAARRGYAVVGERPELLAIDAVQSSEAGDVEAADRAFAKLPPTSQGAQLAEARHRLRTRQFDAAQALITAAFSENPWSVAAWAMQAILWRLADDPRSGWLHGQPGLVASHELPLDRTEIDAVADCLRGLHRTRAHPLGQSLRGGTQTRGRLFERLEPEVQQLRAAVETALSNHWQALPPLDAHHPLLRHRDRKPLLDGSWSVRLTDGGFHVAHIHPRGVISSACYLVVPETGSEQEGYLEVGGAPPELGLDLGSLASFAPAPGRMILFPSTMYHGTRPFPRGERLTAAFDVQAR